MGFFRFSVGLVFSDYGNFFELVQPHHTKLTELAQLHNDCTSVLTNIIISPISLLPMEIQIQPKGKIHTPTFSAKALHFRVRFGLDEAKNNCPHPAEHDATRFDFEQNIFAIPSSPEVVCRIKSPP